MAASAALGPAQAAEASTVVTLRDPRLTEVSGIARGVRSPGVFYVHNDSGDSARFFAVDAHTGRVRAEYRVPGATNVDWEDIAAAPDRAGVPSVWLGDIGDNDAKRSEVRLYRVDEPRVGTDRYGVRTQTGRPDVWRLRYPRGPVDAESLAVDRNGQAYIITKSPSGHSVCYRVPSHPDAAHVQAVRKIGEIRIHARANSIVPADLQQMATGAALSPDGTILALRTYTDAFLWHVAGHDVAGALRTAPVRIALPLQRQGEGIGFDGSHLVIDSEGRGSTVLAVQLPAAFRPDETPDGSTTPKTAAASSSAPDGATASPSHPNNHIDLWIGWRILLAVASIALGSVVLVRMIARRRQGPR